ncbi:MAG: efflux RND transporter permease subunit [Lachnospiraceae bacterium]|nr:efflux RND transporter permease subunit [Lachnospiraceae bacterium]
MIAKFSVKKPYTVLVAVVLILILGLVSFTKMTTDLLPSINLPYVIVMTTYPGASPETVEMAVTKPVEASMATVSNIEGISSVSGENYSLVILEFAQSADMDSVSLEIRENLDQIKSYWDDSIGNPVIMKLNPDMLPIMVAAVGIEGMTTAEISDYTTDHLIPELESIEGVASASASGLLEENVHVVIRQDKIDAINKQVFGAIDVEMEEAEQELADGRKELTDGWKELDDSVAELADAQKELEEGKQELANGRADLETGKADLAAGKEELAAKKEQTAKELADKYAQVVDGLAQVEANIATLSLTIQQLQSGIKELEAGGMNKESLQQAATGIAALQSGVKQLGAALEQIAAGMGIDDVSSMTIQAIDTALQNLPDPEYAAQWSTLKDSITMALGDNSWESGTWGDLQTALTEQSTAVSEGLKAYTTLEQTQAGLDKLKSTKAELEAALEALTKGEIEAAIGFGSADAQLAYGEAQLEAAQSQLEAVESQLEAGQEQIDTGLEQIETAKDQLKEAEDQLKEGEEQLEEARADAYLSADMNGVLTVDTVKSLLTAQNFSMPSGYVTEGDVEYLVRVGEKPANVEELAAMPILNVKMDGVEVITLSDVADVFMTDNSDEIYTNVNGSAGVILSMQKQTGYSTGDVSDRINEKFEELMADNENLILINLMDQGIYIDLVMDSIFDNIILGFGLAILILIVFLKDIKPTFIIACSIPISLVAAIVCMYFSGVTLNVISLSGLALGIGMLVDNSIVVIENIYRLRNEGATMREAAVEGAREVAGAIAASTLTTVCVFAPIIFTEGITRQLFVDMGLTIAYSLLASLVMALTVVPAMASKVLTSTKDPTQGGFFDKMAGGYEKVLDVSLRFKPLVLIGVVVLLVISAAASLSKGTAFMPEMDNTQLTVSITLPKDTPLEETAATTDEVISRLETLSDVENIGAMLGSGSMSLMASSEETNATVIYLTTKEDKEKNNQELAREIETLLADIENIELAIQTSSMDLSSLSGSGITIQVSGREIDTLQEIALEVADIVRGVEGTTEVADGLEESTGEVRVLVDRARAMDYGLTVGQIYSQLYAKLASPTSSTILTTDIKEYDVYVIHEKDSTMTKEELQDILLDTTDKEGKKLQVPLSEVAEFADKEGLKAINRSEQSRYIAVTAQIAEGHNVGIVSADVEEALADYELPTGYTLHFSGENETIMEAMEQLMLMLILAVAFMYLIMVAQFQSLLSPFIIMFTIPLAFTGGFLGLYFTGSEVSVIAVIGFVMLSGIIVNNGIVLVDYTNQLREEGMEKHQALLVAGRVRLRPVLMTALTTIFGLLTMAFGTGMGADMSRPMAIVTIGGLTYGTLLTLIVIPCIYDLFQREKKN